MKKIVELLIDWDNLEFDDLGVEVMSLVDKPAIGIDFLAFNEEVIVDNTGFEKFDKFFNDNIELFKKPGAGQAGDTGVNHAEQMKLLKAAGVNTEYPFGYCYQVAQFLFYAMGGYNGPYDLKCIKKMQYKVDDVDFEATHWYIQHKEDGTIVDLTASQFDGILDINDYYSEGKRANLGFPYYNVNGQRVEFDNTVPSFQSLKLYSKWREDNETLKELEKYYVASKYEELRKDFAEHTFVEPNAGESESEFISRCIPVVKGEGYKEDQAAAICYSYWEGQEFDLDDACWPGWEAIGLKPKGGKMVPNCVPVENQKFAKLYDTKTQAEAVAKQLGCEGAHQMGDKWMPCAEHQEFESYTDYPDAAKNNAQRAIDYAEENGWGSCGTPVGKRRASQLAKGEPISEETIARMASFKRHEQYKDVPYTEGCGGLMWDAWGGSAGINWAQSKLAKIRKEEFKDEEFEEMQTFILGLMEEFGETVDYENAVYVDTTKSDFENIGDYVKGIVGLDILGRQDLDSEPEIKYRYAGAAPQRNFCKAMMRLNKLYTRQEIREMDSRINTGFRHNNTPYSIFDFKGGVNCNHYWEELEVYKDGRETVIMSKGRAQGRAGQIASSSNDYWRYPGTFAFSSDDEMIVTGPAMVPQQLIVRKDTMGNPFHVYFSKDTIRKIAQKFFEYNKQNNTDVNHDDNITTNNTLLESWIVEDPKMDKSTAMGFNVPAGTWMASYKINDEETWKKIKNGELNGYSIAGNFIEKATNI